MTELALGRTGALHPSRRAVLVALAGGLAGGLATACTSSTPEQAGSGAGGPRTPGAPSPDDLLAVDVAESVIGLLAAYDRTLARHPDLAPRLAPLRAEGQAHLDALAGVLPSTPSAPSPSAPTPSSPSPSSPSPSPGVATPPATAAVPAPEPVPGEPAAAVAALAARELTLAGSRPGGLADASPELAVLVATIGAAEAVHAALLGGSR